MQLPVREGSRDDFTSLLLQRFVASFGVRAPVVFLWSLVLRSLWERVVAFCAQRRFGVLRVSSPVHRIGLDFGRQLPQTFIRR
jgi:hypothetical protein